MEAQQLLPPVTNFSVNDYGAASQNWDVGSAEDGVVYAANNEGLLRYDGQRWQLYSLPNKTIIRSVLCVGKRIYTGSYEEFGFWEKDLYGSLSYTSLTHLLQPASFNNEEFWQIEPYKDGVAFRSFGQVYIYDNKTIRAIKPDFLITSLLNVKGKLIIGSNKGQVYTLTGSKLELLSSNTTPEGVPIAALTYFEDQLILGTKADGLFKMQDQEIVPWENSELNDFLITHELNKISTITTSTIAFGTIQGGLLIFDSNKGRTLYYNRGNGLTNNTVLALHEINGNLWVGLDNGLDKIKLQGGISIYLEETGELGAVYDIAIKGNDLYLGTNTGIHLIRDNHREFVPGSQGQLWSFSALDDQLIANHNRGIFKIKGLDLHEISDLTGSYSTTALLGSDDFYISATYNGLRLLKRGSDNLEIIENPDSTLYVPLNKIVFQDETTLWASHPYKNFYKVQIDQKDKHITSYKTYGRDSVFSAFKTNVYRIKDQISFYNNGEWFVYNTIQDSILKFDALRSYSDFELVGQENEAFWFKNRKGSGLIYTDFAGDSIYISEPLLEDNLIKGYENIERINDSIFYIALNDGYAALNLNAFRRNRKNEEIPKPQLEYFKNTADPIQINGASEEPSFKRADLLTLGFSAPTVSSSSFIYKLGDNTEKPMENGFVDFQNLDPGHYDLKIWTLVNGSKSKDPLIISFSIRPPWYFSGFAKGLYLMLMVIIIISIYIVNKHKLNQHRRELEKRIEKEQERKVQIAERNNLLKEIDIKRKELANSTYQAAQRNKILIEVKKELAEVKDKFESKSKYNAIDQKISTMVEGKNDWKVFEANFKDVNQDFFQNLLKQYPNLSTKDLKLCAYLKMNLSTKEIAPLMAITVRGVEIHRYRLRKKLDIKTTKNLSKFLIKNF